MDFAKIPTYSVADLERKAQRILEEKLGDGFSLPVDVEIVLERLEGVVFDIWPGLRLRHLVEGMVTKDIETGELCVFVDDDLADHNHNRYRMTVAEELGHVVLHRAAIDQINTADDFLKLQECDKWAQMERNAKRFAAAVLMPGERVLDRARLLYPKLVSIAGFNDQEAILNYLAAKLAQDFEVSQQAMHFRLNEYPAEVAKKVREAMNQSLKYF